jgi:hypothetical protein
VVFLGWIGCVILAAIVGSRKEAQLEGGLLGLLFGPLGVIAALGLDSRGFCYRCGARLNRRPQICQFCHSPLIWTDFGSTSPEEAEKKRLAREKFKADEQAAAEQIAAERAAEKKRRAEEKAAARAAKARAEAETAQPANQSQEFVKCSCGLRLQVPASLRGQQGQCPQCGNVFDMP